MLLKKKNWEGKTTCKGEPADRMKEQLRQHLIYLLCCQNEKQQVGCRKGNRYCEAPREGLSFLLSANSDSFYTVKENIWYEQHAGVIQQLGMLKFYVWSTESAMHFVKLSTDLSPNNFLRKSSEDLCTL